MSNTYAHSVSASRIFPIDRALLFATSQDMDLRPEWDTQIESLGFMPGSRRLKVQAEVFVVDKSGGRSETRYLRYDIPVGITVIQTDTSRFFSAFEGRWDYEELDNQNTRLTLRYSYNLRFPYSLVPALVTGKIRKKMEAKLELLFDFMVEENPETGLA